MIRLALSLLAFIITQCAYGQDAKSSEPDCHSTKAQALTSVPAKAEHLARFVCHEGKHYLTAADNWAWVVPDFSKTVAIPARPSFGTESGAPMYYSKAEIREITGPEVTARWSVIGEVLPDQEEPQSTLEISAATNRDGEVKVYLFKNGWGYFCAPICHAFYAFLVKNKDNAPIDW
ncbi:hypothetical protein OPU71_20540 [Niveibacterium sp. 24ML]|uniref:hypothetical protein n=1 Tax=Niveibacterium sp. 24ML TaxID=2985512 RepID=UPI00226FE6D3|nr:hypothetical protein [Niveibacterium sp. 24ML]MCX9158518.1 hypothetical protein [Niveibacterium sp. 24ML]